MNMASIAAVFDRNDSNDLHTAKQTVEKVLSNRFDAKSTALALPRATSYAA
jgi:hypothetical protein